LNIFIFSNRAIDIHIEMEKKSMCS
jgi:hypothetical protein